METLEHLSDELLDGYVDRLAGVTDRFTFITCPNEIGPICLVKQTIKRLVLEGSTFSWPDIWHATLGRTQRIIREDHRGFNYQSLLARLRASFRVIAVHGIPFAYLPPILNVTVGIVCAPQTGRRVRQDLSPAS